MYDTLVELIERTRVAFPPFGQGVSEEAIKAAERVLGVYFPPSYRWWLRSYGGGQVGGDIVYGIDEAQIDAPDVVKVHATDVKDDIVAPQQLRFYVGNAESFYFDTAERLTGGECPIYYREAGQQHSRYASGFHEILRKRIAEVL